MENNYFESKKKRRMERFLVAGLFSVWVSGRAGFLLLHCLLSLAACCFD